MDFIEVIKAVILGIIQGITEWLPISSTGHLILFDNIWPMASSPEFFEVFKVVIQFGSILAVLVLFFDKLNPFSPKKGYRDKKETFDLWKKVVAGCIPIVIVGLPLDMILEDYLSGVYVIAATLILYGIAYMYSRVPKGSYPVLCRLRLPSRESDPKGNCLVRQATERQAYLPESCLPLYLRSR